MSADWESTSWGNLVELKYGKALKGYKDAEGEFPVFGTNGPVGWCSQPLCDFPSVIVGRKGAYRGIHFSDKPFHVIDTAFYINPKTDINLKWAYYALLLVDINGMDSGSAIPSTSRDDFYALPARIPKRHEQDWIVDQLDALNDKIELNRQINTTLESMAQALFKSWFVDFDPVIDNALAAGNDIPGALQAKAAKRKALGANRKPLPDDLQQQFPDRFVFTEEMGWMPEGWRTLPFEDLVEAKQGKYLAKGDMSPLPSEDHKYPVWGGNGILGYAKNYSYDRPTTLMTCRGSNCGLIKTTKSSAWVSNNSFACRPKFGSDYFLYLYFLMEDFAGCVSGSAQPQITYTALRSKKMKYPINESLCETFSEVVEVYRQKQFQNDFEIGTLTNLRDTLLPKLLSGELSIPDAEKQIAEVV
ncbi:restriction endonuclease subunit S [Spongiibacter marinus]|uniref:restriction endonuclease subunit S n=1 Tax=Spongiibacter marinus TaxID=354246 RepID=UPI003561C20F